MLGSMLNAGDKIYNGNIPVVENFRVREIAFVDDAKQRYVLVPLRGTEPNDWIPWNSNTWQRYKEPLELAADKIKKEIGL